MRSMRQKRARVEGNEGETSSDRLVPLSEGNMAFPEDGSRGESPRLM